VSDRDRPTSGHWSALTIKGRSFPSLAKLKISRRPAGRELEDWAERAMVRFGLMTRSSRDWDSEAASITHSPHCCWPHFARKLLALPVVWPSTARSTVAHGPGA
jgi:hypothetical protein